MRIQAYIRIILAGLVVLLSGCRQSPPEVRSLLSFQDVWDASKKQHPYFYEGPHAMVVRTESVRQKEIVQLLVENKITDMVALLEYESAGCDLKGIYTVIVVTKHTAYKLRFFNKGREVSRLKISEAEMSEACKCVDALDRYKGEHLAAWDADFIFMTTYKNKRPTAMFFEYKTMVAANKSMRARGESPQSQMFYRLCEILFLAQREALVDEKTDVEYPSYR